MIHELSIARSACLKLLNKADIADPRQPKPGWTFFAPPACRRSPFPAEKARRCGQGPGLAQKLAPHRNDASNPCSPDHGIPTSVIDADERLVKKKGRRRRPAGRYQKPATHDISSRLTIYDTPGISGQKSTPRRRSDARCSQLSASMPTSIRSKPLACVICSPTIRRSAGRYGFATDGWTVCGAEPCQKRGCLLKGAGGRSIWKKPASFSE